MRYGIEIIEQRPGMIREALERMKPKMKAALEDAIRKAISNCGATDQEERWYIRFAHLDGTEAVWPILFRSKAQAVHHIVLCRRHLPADVCGVSFPCVWVPEKRCIA